MLRNISQQIHEDGEAQEAIEASLAQTFADRKQRNLAALAQYYPQLLDHVHVGFSEDCLSVFCTKAAQPNLVDFASGRCWYGVDGETEITREVEAYLSNAFKINLHDDEVIAPPEALSQYGGTTFVDVRSWCEQRVSPVPLPHTVPLLICFGLGLGTYLDLFDRAHSIETYLVYEPSVDVFNTSLQTYDWAGFFERAIEQGRKVYLQIGNNAGSLDDDLKYIKSAHGIEEAFVYRHSCHPEMDACYQYLISRHYRWSDLIEGKVGLYPFHHPLDDVPPRSEDIYHLCRPSLNAEEQEKWREAKMRFFNNIQAFMQYYPNIAEAFYGYTPVAWHLFLDKEGCWNIYNSSRGVALYGCNTNETIDHEIEWFRKFPNKEDALLDNTGGKLWRYRHFYYVHQFRKMCQSEAGGLSSIPDYVPGLILLGMGLGYQLQSLSQLHSLQNIYICEPNHDFFYASLYVVDWDSILSSTDKNGGRCYLNLGDDGSHLSSDLVGQFSRIGVYNVVNAYIYQSYYHPVLQKAAFDLRNELKVLVSMGEYFEHAAYGLSHMQQVFTQGRTYLARRDIASRCIDGLNIPVIVLGNGPSLDEVMPFLKLNRERFILVSCGTALKPLYKSGIKPDFHTEVEQTYCTYKWISSIKDDDYLSDIVLLTINGVHPETAKLFGSVAMALKVGEGSTHAYEKSVCPESEFLSVEYSFPTVSNCALALLSHFGFKEIYLMGVDLGYITPGEHHSKLSDYYVETSEGRRLEVYDFAKAHGMIAVPGNFRDYVYSKHEFRISAQIIERLLSYSPHLQCFNCSDGARINGAIPMKASDIAAPEVFDRQQWMSDFLQRGFHQPERSLGLFTGFNEYYDSMMFHADVKAFLSWLKRQDITSRKELELFSVKQREIFSQSLIRKRSLFFYFYWGSMSYITALIMKLGYLLDDEALCMEKVNQGIGLWIAYVEDTYQRYVIYPEKVESTNVVNPNW